MGKRVFIHIGTDKTGSTAIQSFLKRNCDVLARRGIRFVASGSFDNHHGPLWKELKQGEVALLDKVVSEVTDCPEPTCVLTSEGLYSLPESGIRLLVERLASFDVMPILYLRRRSDKFRSGFAQVMKFDPSGAGAARLFADHFSVPEAGFDYASIVERWERSLAAHGIGSSLCLRIYERSSFIGGDLLTDFLTAVNALDENETGSSSEFNALPSDPNSSVGPAAQYLMAMTRILELDQHAQRRVLETIREFDGACDRKLSLVPDEIANELDGRYEQSDSILAERYFGREELFLEPPQFQFGRPSGERFVELIRMLHQRYGTEGHSASGGVGFGNRRKTVSAPGSKRAQHLSKQGLSGSGA